MNAHGHRTSQESPHNTLLGQDYDIGDVNHKIARKPIFYTRRKKATSTCHPSSQLYNPNHHLKNATKDSKRRPTDLTAFPRLCVAFPSTFFFPTGARRKGEICIKNRYGSISQKRHVACRQLPLWLFSLLTHAI